MDNSILLAIFGMGGLGLFFATILAIANEKFKIKEDPRIVEIEEALPGINCGACGLLSCHDYAVHIANKTMPIDNCRPGGENTQARLAKIMGVDPCAVVKRKVVVHCAADSKIRKQKARYAGSQTCRGAHMTKGGEILCEYGCLGYGDCYRACPFGAVEMINGLPKIKMEKCVACGKCIDACPRKIISIEELDDEGGLIYVACSSLDAGAQTRKTCSVGCIACTICARLSNNAFIMKDNLSRPDYAKLKNLEKKDEIMLKCPTKVIKKI